MALQTKLSPVVDKRDSGREFRQSQRFRVLLNAELISTIDEQAVRVRDLSSGGAMIEGQRPITKAKDLILRRGSIEIFASIEWTNGNACGVRFDEVLSEADMMAFVREPVKRASFVPEPFKTAPYDEALPLEDRAAGPGLHGPIGSGIFGR